jgi:hypothetical protein
MLKGLSQRLILAGVLTMSAATVAGTSAAADTVVHLCHRQGHALIPLTLSESGALGHAGHSDDVIPPFGTFPGQNWPATEVDQFCNPVNAAPAVTTTTTLPPTTTTEPPTTTTEPPTTTTEPPTTTTEPPTTTTEPVTTTTEPVTTTTEPVTTTTEIPAAAATNDDPTTTTVVPTTTTTEPSSVVSPGPVDGPTTTLPQGVGDTPGGVEDANTSTDPGTQAGIDPSTAPSDLSAPSEGVASSDSVAPSDPTHVDSTPTAQLAFTGSIAGPFTALGSVLVLAGALIAFKGRRARKA